MPPSLKWSLSEETEALGTGGAVLKACALAKDQYILVANGDSYFGVDLDILASQHIAIGAHCTLGLKPMENFDRYGVVELDAESRVSSFKRKFYAHGLINGGMYALTPDALMNQHLPEKFSLEKDFSNLIIRQAKYSGRSRTNILLILESPPTLKGPNGNYLKIH
jgi:D-glycero-alpha-D-manno-heptose 1-phosphate guanylyltransferase